jgi:hypothetical protein
MLNLLKDLILKLASVDNKGEVCGVEQEIGLRDWSLDYESDWQNSFDCDLKNLEKQVLLINEAMQKGNVSVAIEKLAVARVFSMNLNNLFEGLRDDIERVIVSKRNIS